MDKNSIFKAIVENTDFQIFNSKMYHRGFGVFLLPREISDKIWGLRHLIENFGVFGRKVRKCVWRYYSNVFLLSGSWENINFDQFWEQTPIKIPSVWPSWLQIASRWLQVALLEPIWAYLSRFGSNLWPSRLQVGSGWAHAGPKLAPSWLKLGPRWPQVGSS